MAGEYSRESIMNYTGGSDVIRAEAAVRAMAVGGATVEFNGVSHPVRDLRVSDRREPIIDHTRRTIAFNGIEYAVRDIQMSDVMGGIWNRFQGLDDIGQRDSRDAFGVRNEASDPVLSRLTFTAQAGESKDQDLSLAVVGDGRRAVRQLSPKVLAPVS